MASPEPPNRKRPEQGTPKGAPQNHGSASYQLSMLRAFELPPLYREVVVLRELHGHAVHEIAALLGISRSAVEKRLRRAGRMQAASKSHS